MYSKAPHCTHTLYTGAITLFTSNSNPLCKKLQSMTTDKKYLHIQYMQTCSLCHRMISFNDSQNRICLQKLHLRSAIPWR